MKLPTFKDYVRKRNVHGTLKITEELVRESIGQISPENWSKAIQHSIKQENLYAFHDKIDSTTEQGSFLIQSYNSTFKTRKIKITWFLTVIFIDCVKKELCSVANNEIDQMHNAVDHNGQWEFAESNSVKRGVSIF